MEGLSQIYIFLIFRLIAQNISFVSHCCFMNTELLVDCQKIFKAILKCPLTEAKTHLCTLETDFLTKMHENWMCGY